MTVTMESTGSNTWSDYVTKHKLVGALVAGFVATHVATITGMWYIGVGLDNMNWPAFNGILLLPEGSPNQQFLAGAIFHGFTGICFALIFAFLVHPKLPLPNTAAGNMGKALIFAAVLTLISGLWWVPQLSDAGVFANTFFGWKGLAGIVLWHVIYAVHLGALFNPKD